MITECGGREPGWEVGWKAVRPVRLVQFSRGLNLFLVKPPLSSGGGGQKISRLGLIYIYTTLCKNS